MGSLTKASKLLSLPKSKISRDLAKLEDLLEQTLFTRSPRGIQLTEQGYKLVKFARPLFESLDNSLSQLKSDHHEVKGNIRLTAPEDLAYSVLLELVNKFIEQYPKVNVEIFSSTDFLDLQNNNIDIALRAGRLENSSYKQRKIADVKFAVVGGVSFIKSLPKIKKTCDLESIPIAAPRSLDGKNVFLSGLGDINRIFSSNSMLLLKKFVLQNSCLGILPKVICEKEIARGELLEVEVNGFSIERKMFLLSQPLSHVPKHIKLFKDFLHAELVEALK